MSIPPPEEYSAVEAVDIGNYFDVQNIRVAIIICTRDRAESLRHTLASMGNATVPDGWEVELLVVDNGSTDDTEAVVANTTLPHLRLRYLFEHTGGKSHALNRGLSATDSDVILFTDDDVRVPEDWISAMAEPILSKKTDAVQGLIRPAPHLERDWLKGVYRNMLAIVEPRPGEAPERLVGANMSIGKHVLRDVPGFSTDLGPGAAGLAEDTLLGLQLIRAGYRLAYADGGEVEHHFDETRLNSDYFFSWVAKAGRSNAIMCVKHLGDTVRFPRTVWAWTMAKYLVRRTIDWRQRPVPPAWVISYLHLAAYSAACATLQKFTVRHTLWGSSGHSSRSPVRTLANSEF